MSAVTTDRRISGTETLPRPPREDAPPAVWPVWALKMRQDYEAKLAALQRHLDELENSMINTDAARRQADGQNKTLALYGESQAVKDLTSRLNVLLPNAEQIGLPGVALVAQIAIAHGLDPLPGSDHIYAWMGKDRKTGEKRLTVAVGYKGLLHLARKQVHFTAQSRAMTPDERAEHALLDGEVGYLTTLYEIDKAVECRQASVPYFPIIGSAVWRPSDEVPKGRTSAWVAKKNSLKDALRQITSTGVRMERALDEAFDQDAAEWRMPLPESPILSEQELLVTGAIPPDDDGEPETIEGSFTVTPALCANCGVEPAVSTPLGETLCETCATRQANAEAAAR